MTTGSGATRVLGVDLGTVRVGVAVSDPGRTIAGPLDTVPAGPDLADRLVALAAEHRAGTIVVGLPKGMAGRDTASTQLARGLASELAARGVHVELWDERLSTAEAERVLLQAGRRRSQRLDERDRVAAAIILQGWLDARAAAATSVALTSDSPDPQAPNA